ncbi:MAG: cheA5 [Clostridiales bacterium]|nr:cheA5 [Clostridiales bacterium]
MVENLVIDVPTLSVEHSGDDAQTIFKNMPQLEGIVVLDNETPVGLIMRPFFYQKIGTLYGHSLYITRKLSILMDTSILIVDSSQSIPEVVSLAMERDHDRLYDYIVVIREDKYVGVINIKMFLTELTKHREEHIAVLKTQHEELQKANQEEKK